MNVISQVLLLFSHYCLAWKYVEYKKIKGCDSNHLWCWVCDENSRGVYHMTTGWLPMQGEVEADITASRVSAGHIIQNSPHLHNGQPGNPWKLIFIWLARS